MFFHADDLDISGIAARHDDFFEDDGPAKDEHADPETAADDEPHAEVVQ